MYILILNVEKDIINSINMVINIFKRVYSHSISKERMRGSVKERISTLQVGGGRGPDPPFLPLVRYWCEVSCH